MVKQIFVTTLLCCSSIIMQGQQTRNYLIQDEQYNKGVDLFTHKNYAAAYEQFSAYADEQNKLEAIPTELQINAEMYRALSATYSGKQNGILLVEDFLNTYPSHPNTSLARLEMAKYYFADRQFNQALSHLEAIAPETLPAKQLDEYNMSIGYTYFVKKQFSKAERYLQQVATSIDSPNKVEATYYLGLSQYFQNDYNKALANFDSIAGVPRYSQEIKYYKARIVFEKGNYQEAISILEPMLKAGQGNSAEISQIVGQSYFNLENYEKALPYLEEYSANASALSAEAQYQLAYTQYQLGHYQKAVQNFEKLNIIDDEIGQYALYAMAQSYLQLNDKEKAKNAFARAGKLNFNAKIKENALFHEAKLNYELGRNSEALSTMQAFIQQYPSSTHQREANEMLVDLFLTSNNYKDALAILEQMDNRSSKMNEAYQKVAYFRAVELYNSGDLSASKTLLDKVIDLDIDKRYSALSNYWLGEMAYEYNRYELSNDYMQRFLQSSVQKPDEYVAQANYTLGYGYYKQKEYANAAKAFQSVGGQYAFSNDANLRKGDSYFAQRNYNQAISAYNQVKSENSSNGDYASFQLAILSGLQGNNSSKLSQLQNLYNQKPNSAYADDALFEYGRVYVTQENYSQAKQSFNQLLSKYPNSEKVLDTYNQLGLIEYNLNNYSQALNYYDKIVQNYPNSEEAVTALSTIEEIYIEMGQPNEYFAYLKKVKGVNVDQSKQEEVIYQAAETQFQNGNCERALAGFNDYLQQFKRGFYAANAHFYKGECYLQQNKANEANTEFEAVIGLAPNKFVERSHIRVARHSYRNGDYNKAISNFKAINNLGGTSIYADEITIGLMQANLQLNNRTEATQYAQKVLSLDQVDKSIRTQAQFLLAYQAYSNGNTEQARQQLQQVANNSTNQYGAEARYILAKMYYNQKAHQQSIDACYRVADETPSQDDWVAKSFILIADNYSAMNELFQAKATLDSVIENYKGNDASILDEAKQKRAKIISKERNQSTIIATDEQNNQLQLQDN